MITEAEAREALTTVYDPELGINVVDLGLVYDLDVHDGVVRLRMTLTSPGCPLGATIEEGVRELFHLLPGVKGLDFAVVWDPPWSPDRITPAGRLALGMA